MGPVRATKENPSYESSTNSAEIEATAASWFARRNAKYARADAGQEPDEITDHEVVPVGRHTTRYITVK